MEVRQLKERANQLQCPCSQGDLSADDNPFKPASKIANHSIDVPDPEPNRRAVEALTRRFSITDGLTSVLASLLVLLSPLAMGQLPNDSVSENEPDELSASAQQVFLDPKTGRLLSEPPPGARVLALSPTELNMLSTSHAELVETRLPGGGYMIDLRGRFQNMAVATLTDDGTIVIQEVAGEVFLPADSEQAGGTEDE